MTRVYPLKRPAYRVEVRRDGSPWQWRSSWHELAHAERDAVRAGEERGWLLHRLYPHVRIVDADKTVLAAYQLGAKVYPVAASAEASA